MTKKVYDVGFGVAIVGLSIYVGKTVSDYPKVGISQGFGPGIYPLILAGALLVLGLFIIISALFDKTHAEITDLNFSTLKRPVLFWVLLLMLCVALKPLGLLLSSFLYLLISSRFLFRVRWRVSLITSLSLPVIIWVLFVVGMRVPLPTGTIWKFIG